MTIKQFIEDYILGTEGQSPNSIGYIAQHNIFDQIEELRKDFTIPDYCSMYTGFYEDESDHQPEVDINGWFGPGNTISPLHYDPKDNLLAQVFGSKYIRLYAADTPLDMIYPHESNLLHNTSQVDVENVDVLRFPKFAQVPYQESILNAGQMLFIPKRYWHYVRSLETSFSISFWWE